MKIKWAVCKMDDVAKFKADLQGHTRSIQILLHAIEIKRNSIEAIKRDQQHNTIATMIQDMSFQWMTKVSAAAKTIMLCFQQGKQLLELTAGIMRMNIQIFQAVLDLSTIYHAHSWLSSTRTVSLILGCSRTICTI